MAEEVGWLSCNWSSFARVVQIIPRRPGCGVRVHCELGSSLEVILEARTTETCGKKVEDDNGHLGAEVSS